MLDLTHLEQLTIEYGESWAYPHVRRLLKLFDIIGADVEYDRVPLLYATYLHDWGAFPKFRQSGVDHALRSKQIAEADILPQTDLSPAGCAIILEAIERHDYRDPRPVQSIEALLLREADWLDFLGVIGIVREIAWSPNALLKSRERMQSRHDGIQGRLTLPRAKVLAEERITEMELFLRKLDDESFGHL